METLSAVILEEVICDNINEYLGNIFISNPFFLYISAKQKC